MGKYGRIISKSRFFPTEVRARNFKSGENPLSRDFASLEISIGLNDRVGKQDCAENLEPQSASGKNGYEAREPESARKSGGACRTSGDERRQERSNGRDARMAFGRILKKNETVRRHRKVGPEKNRVSKCRDDFRDGVGVA